MVNRNLRNVHGTQGTDEVVARQTKKHDVQSKGLVGDAPVASLSSFLGSSSTVTSDAPKVIPTKAVLTNKQIHKPKDLVGDANNLPVASSSVSSIEANRSRGTHNTWYSQQNGSVDNANQNPKKVVSWLIDWIDKKSVLQTTAQNAKEKKFNANDENFDVSSVV